MAHEAERLFGKVPHPFPHLCRKDLEKVPSKRGDILLVLTQGRDQDPDYIESIEKIFAERALSYLFL
jgi:hypothetical protein